MARQVWNDARLKHTAEVRQKIMACIQRLNTHESKAISRATMRTGSVTLPRPYLRQQIRSWYYQRWSYLIAEYEAILPNVEELPPEKVASIVKSYLMGVDCASNAR
jgi:hypothetical protein